MPVPLPSYTEGQEAQLPSGKSTVWALYDSYINIYSTKYGDYQTEVHAGQKLVLDGSIWHKLSVVSGQVTIYIGINMGENPTAPLGYEGPSSGALSTMKTNNTIGRMLELIRPVTNGNSVLEVDASLAAAASGSDTTGFQTVTVGTEVEVIWGMSQDSLGTSPHASYMSIIGGTSDQVYFKARGAVNPYGTYRFRVYTAESALNIAWENGDSVAHWFLLFVRRVLA
jgi:hypothetical protein